MLCQLYTELQLASAGAAATTTNATSSSFALLNPEPVVCAYEAHPTSAEELCELWCELQEYLGLYCITCPAQYLDDPEEELLCQLWTEAEILQQEFNNFPLLTTPSPVMITCLYRQARTP
jgi:hypothetical protein